MRARIPRPRSVASGLAALALALALAGAPPPCPAAVNAVGFGAPNFRPAEGVPTRASQAELRVSLDATPSRYRLDVFRVGGPAQIVAQRTVDHPGPAGTPRLHDVLVPLDEGANSFTVNVRDLNQPNFAGSSGASATLTRDLENTLSRVTLDRLEPVVRTTNQATATLVFTIFGIAAGYAVEVERNGVIILPAAPGFVPGEQRIPNVALLEGDNFFRVRATSLDPLSADPPAFSNPLRIVRDSTAPVIAGLIVANPPLPTTQAVVSIAGDTEPFAVVRVRDPQGNVFEKRADPLGNFVLNGIELPLVLPGPTTTIFQVDARDDAGNVSAVTALPATRVAGLPRFEFIRITPFDGTEIQPEDAVQTFGLAGQGAAPYTVKFLARAGFGLPALEETILVLDDADPFQKDTILVGSTTSPGSDVVWSFESTVESTAGTTPRHFLGSVVLDVADPAPFVPLDVAFDGVPVFGARSFTLEGAAERASSVQLVGFNGVQILPQPLVPTQPTPIAPGAEFRAVIDAGGLGDGEFSVLSTVIATSGRTSQRSQRQIPFVVDRTAPAVIDLEVDGVDSQSGRVLFRTRNQLVTLRVAVEEPMPEPPEVYVTQEGFDAVRATFTLEPVAERVFEYAFAVQDASDLDGPVEVVVVGGADRAGNPIAPARRFPAALVVDSQAPILDSLRTRPADGSLITSPPNPFVATLVEPPGSGVPASGPAPALSDIRVLGPLELTPLRVHPGRVDPFDSHTLEYFPDPGTWDVEGTYQVEVTSVDQAGNRSTQVIILILDSTPPAPSFVLATDPAAGEAVGPTGLSTDAQGRQFLTATFDVTSPGDISLDRSTLALRNFCPVPFDVPGTTTTVLPATRRLTLGRNLRADGSDDGLYTLRVRVADPAGNLQAPVDVNWVFDTRPPLVLDGLQQSLPGSPIPTTQGVFPGPDAVVRGPLRQLSALVQDGVSGNGFTGSGIKTDPVTGTRFVLTLEGRFPTTTAPVGFSTAGSPIATLSFEELTGPELSPCFLGLRRSRALLSLFAAPVTGIPAGLPADGRFDGRWRIDVTPVDRAGNRGPVNTSRFVYDTVPPTVDLDTVLNDRVFTGPRLALTGRARDEDKDGNDVGLGLKRVQVRLDATDPTGITTLRSLIPFTDAILTPDPRIVPSELELPWRIDRRIPAYEGRARLLVRVEDVAGNESFLVRELFMEVDPLPAPVLVVPANGAGLAGAVQRFEWEDVEGASSYELEIKDRDGNPVLRRVDFSSRFVDVNLATLAEGNYTWTVRAVDTGGTRGLPALARRFLLDKTLPRVLRIFPYDATVPNASAGTLLGSQIRVAIDFSEPMRTTTPPVVLIDPADPAVPATAVAQLAYEGERWRGVVDLPATPNAPDVNGQATVIVRSAFDLAGNPIAETRADFEIDIGPFWEVRAFANPILKRELVFYFRARTSARGPLDALNGVPYITVQQQGAVRPRVMEVRRLTPSIFYGTYLVDATLPGVATLRIQGTDAQGNTSNRALAFSIAQLLRADQNQIRFASGPLTVSLPARAAAADEVLTILPPACDAEGFGPGGDGEPVPAAPEPELELVRKLDALIPGRTPLLRPGTVHLPLAAYGLGAADGWRGLGLFTRRDGAYHLHAGRIAEGALAASVDELSTFFLMRDVTAPRLGTADGLAFAVEGATLELPAADRGAGIDPAGVRARLGKLALPARYRRDTGMVLVDVPARKAGQELEVEVADRLGNVTVASLPVGAAGEVPVLEAVAVPNPARTRTRIRYRLGTAGDGARLRIHDAAAGRILSLEGPAGAGLNEIPWDLRDARGRAVANGVYLAELAIRAGGRETRRTLKIAVLR